MWTATATPSCLCLFDVDRTLTGQQDLVAPRCPKNEVMPNVNDSAYGGGNLTLSQVGESLANTFCSDCLVGIVTAGDTSGLKSQERNVLAQRLQSQLISHEWSGPSAGGEARRACKPSDAQSMLIAGCLDGTKQEAAKGILSWLSKQNINISSSDVWHFDDRSENIEPFKGTGMNARQVSCATRNQQVGIGVCGATPQEILRQPGVALCGAENLVV
eukprot:Skav226669  [mRNA]  locus=scaffold861:228014:228661:+ [translate_table: standard]